MRGVSKWASCVAPLLSVFVVVTAASAWADEPPPTEPPQARVAPPVGVTAQARVAPPVGVTTQARVAPPVGVTARLQPPSGVPLTPTELMLLWLQSRIGTPNR